MHCDMLKIIVEKLNCEKWMEIRRKDWDYNHLQKKRDANAPAPSPMLMSECEHHFMALD